MTLADGKNNNPVTGTPTSVMDPMPSGETDLSSLVRSHCSLTKDAEVPLDDARSSFIRLSVIFGRLCSFFLLTATEERVRPGAEIEMCNLLDGLLSSSSILSINLHSSILKKMELNRKKYPVELCKVR